MCACITHVCSSHVFCVFPIDEILCANHPVVQIDLCVHQSPDLHWLDESHYLLEYKRANISKTDNAPGGGDSTKASTSVTEEQPASFPLGEMQLNNNAPYIKQLQ